MTLDMMLDMMLDMPLDMPSDMSDMDTIEDIGPDINDPLDMPDLSDLSEAPDMGDMGDLPEAMDMEDAPDMVVMPGPQLSTIAAGSAHTCSLQGEELYCWGLNSFGQRGDDTVADEDNRALPMRVASPQGDKLTSVVAGQNHTCALTQAGHVYCWGRNNRGQLGQGASAPTSLTAPTRVPNLEGVDMLAAGGEQTCAIKAGALLCWGANSNGQIGNGSGGPNIRQDTPVAVSNMGEDVTAVAIGNSFACAIKAGDLYCWGSNHRGQLGTNTMDAPEVVNALPALTISSKDVTQVAANGRTACAIKAGGALLCWGDNSQGQAGVGAATTELLAPTPVVGMNAGVTHVAVAELSACAVKGGIVSCWGSDTYGQLADGAAGPGLRSPAVSGALSSDVTALTAGAEHLCAVQLDQLKCWGANATGPTNARVGASQLGQRSFAPHPIPAPTLPIINNAPDNIDQLVIGRAHACSLRGGEVFCWGQNTYGQLGDGSNAAPNSMSMAPPRGRGGLIAGGAASFTAIGTGAFHTCAITAAGALLCWGNNARGSLGNGNLTTRSSPQAVMGMASDVTSVTGGFNHTCAIQDGKLYCWGQTTNGKLGVTLPANHNGVLGTPQEVVNVGTSVQAVAAGSDHTCAIAANDTLYCWGLNDSGQLGQGNTTPLGLPAEVKYMSAPLLVSAVSAGEKHTCAIQKGTDLLLCWGEGGAGQLGNGTLDDALTPTLSINSQLVKSIQLGDRHSCATLKAAASADEVRCWGNNIGGQLGRIERVNLPNAAAPLATPAIKTARLSAGGDQTCAMINAKLWCWGRNGDGQLTSPHGVTNLSAAPLVVPLP